MQSKYFWNAKWLWSSRLVDQHGFNCWGESLRHSAILAVDFCLPQTLLKGWSTRAYFWTGTMAVPFSTLGATRTLALATLPSVAQKVSALLCICRWLSSNPFSLTWKKMPLIIGITFSFFWKNYEDKSRFAVASGGKVISNGFSVYTNPFGGYVEFYTRGNNHRWKANIQVPGNFVCHNFELTSMYIKIKCILVMNLKVFFFGVMLLRCWHRK